MKIKTILLSEIRDHYPVILIGSFEGDKNLERQVALLGEEAVSQVKGLKQDKIFTGKSRESFPLILNQSKLAKGVILFGLGPQDKFSLKSLREMGSSFLAEIRRLKAKTAAILLPSFSNKKFPIDIIGQTMTESLLLSEYKFDRYRLKKEEDVAKKSLESVDFLVLKSGEQKLAERGKEIGEIIAESVKFARDLGNEPANIMTPTRMTQEAKKISQQHGVKCEILGEKEIKKLGMGGILGVAQGSHEPANLVILEYRPKNPKKTICLVGKGITFDTGGISLKPAKDMEKMKYDMMGAACVIASVNAIKRLGLPFHVIGITPICENLPSQKPQRPGDVVTAYNKKSVEVINTDAEGRLILMDALSYSEKFKPDVIIDLATLTGAVAATFADKCIGLMGNDKKLTNRIFEAGMKSGERCWELPMWDDYLDMIKGDITDLKNVGSGYAGTITAAKFLEQFVPKNTPWAHLDIAGVAWADSPKPFTPKGPTGAGIRLLIQLLRDWK